MAGTPEQLQAEIQTLRQEVQNLMQRPPPAPAAPIDYTQLAAAVVAAMSMQTAKGGGKGGRDAQAPKELSLKDLSAFKEFDSSESSWLDWSVRFRSDAAFIHKRLPEWLVKAEDGSTEVKLTSLDPEAQECARLLQTVLTHTCTGTSQSRVQNAGEGEGLLAWRSLVFFYEPRVLVRIVGLLLEVLCWDFTKGVFLERLEAWERQVKRYELLAQDKLSDLIKIGLVLRQLPTSQSKSHLLMSSERLRNWDTFKHEMTTLCMTGDLLSTRSGGGMHSLQGHSPEEGAGYGAQYVDQVGPKGGGRLGNQTNQHKQPKGGGKKFECFTCGWEGHSSAQCPKNPKNTDKDKICDTCKKRGHTSKNCWKNRSAKGGGRGGKARGKGGVNEVDCDPTEVWDDDGPAEQQQEGEPENECGAFDASVDLGGLFVCGLDQNEVQEGCCHTRSCCAVEHLDLKPKGTIQLALDTGSVVTVIKRGEAPQFPLDSSPAARGHTYRSASKHEIHMDGSRQLETVDGRILRTKVGDVSRNLMAACDLLDTGHRVTLDNDGCFAIHKKTHKKIPIKRVGKSFLMDFQLKPRSNQKSSGNGTGRRQVL